MQSASPSPTFSLAALPRVALQRTRANTPSGALWSSLIVFLLVLTISRSTVTATWVPGLLDQLPYVALAGAITMGVLAVSPLPWWLSVLVGLVAGPIVAGYVAYPVFRADDLIAPTPTTTQLFNSLLAKVNDGSVFGDRAFVLLLVTWLMWVTGAWLSWCVLRWRQPMIGLIPGAAALSTNVINYPTDQSGYEFGFVFLTFALLLWSNYTGSIEKAIRSHVKMTGDARWDFWESGLLAMAALIVLSIILPPLSSTDRTVSMESSIFTSWAQLQEQLNHPGAPGTGNGTGGGTTGFSLSVGLGGPLQTSKNPVFTYTVTDTYVGPKYFRGANITETVNGQWVYPSFGNGDDLTARLEANQLVGYAENYQKLALAAFHVNMLSPPRASGDVLFYPGQLDAISRAAQANEVHAALDIAPPNSFFTVDRLVAVNPSRSNGQYIATVEYPNVSADELRAAGTLYPDWLGPYMTVNDTTYRPQSTLNRVHDLALSLTKDAKNPYDAATAIETWLRSDHFSYTLQPPSAPFAVDPLDYFLFTSNKGYCQYFATAMGDMLRSLGIPVRLVNGYGPGTFSTQTGLFTVRDSDAHTWVEVYFPSYGWMPFEPTNDRQGSWNPIPRQVTSGGTICLRDNLCTPTSPGASPSGNPGGKVGFREPNGGSGGSGPTPGFQFRIPDAGTLTTGAGILLAIALLIGALVARYLRPRTVMGVWSRTLVLARLAGARQQPGETPLELGRRLAGVFPEAQSAVRDLVRGFVVAAYAPPDMAPTSRAMVLEAWATLRPLMLRRVAARLRPRRA